MLLLCANRSHRSEFVLKHCERRRSHDPLLICPAAPVTKDDLEAVVLSRSVPSALLMLLCVPLRARLRLHTCTLTVLFVSVCRKPEDLSREVIQFQQREFSLKEQNYALISRYKKLVQTHTYHPSL